MSTIGDRMAAVAAVQWCDRGASPTVLSTPCAAMPSQHRSIVFRPLPHAASLCFLARLANGCGGFLFFFLANLLLAAIALTSHSFPRAMRHPAAASYPQLTRCSFAHSLTRLPPLSPTVNSQASLAHDRPMPLLPLWLTGTLCILFLSCWPPPVAAFFDPVAPQNHRSVSAGAECVAANLPADDFCADVVTYPVSSHLLHERVKDGVLSPRHRGEEHEQLIRENNLHAVLTPRAHSEYLLLREAHEKQGHIHESLPGNSRHRLANAGADPYTIATAPLPGDEACDAVLRRYVCQNQFPRCAPSDDSMYPLQLHTCYALCHSVRDLCHLKHMLVCHGHHTMLDPLHEAPTEHQLKFDPRYTEGRDPYAHFWHVDCIDSPPSRSKHVGLWLLHGGPAAYLAYTVGAVVLFAFASRILGVSGETTTRMLLKQRRERRRRRAVYDSVMRRAQKRYAKLQEIKTALVESAEADRTALESRPAGSSTPGLRSALQERSSKLSQLDNLLAQLEAHVEAERASMTAERIREVREDAELGRIDLATIDRNALRAYLSAGGSGPLSLAALSSASAAREEAALDLAWESQAAEDRLMQAEELAREEEEDDALLGRDPLEGRGEEEEEEEGREETASGQGERSFGRRRKAAEAESPNPLASSPRSAEEEDAALDEYEMVERQASPFIASTTTQRRR